MGLCSSSEVIHWALFSLYAELINSSVEMVLQLQKSKCLLKLCFASVSPTDIKITVNLRLSLSSALQNLCFVVCLPEVVTQLVRGMVSVYFDLLEWCRGRCYTLEGQLPFILVCHTVLITVRAKLFRLVMLCTLEALLKINFYFSFLLKISSAIVCTWYFRV